MGGSLGYGSFGYGSLGYGAAAGGHAAHSHGHVPTPASAPDGSSAGLLAGWAYDLLPLLAVALPLMLAYAAAAVLTGRRYKRWPAYRVALWCAGVLLSAAAVAGPLAGLAHGSFTFHMLGHLLLGMLGPLLLVLSAPMTLLLRTLPRAGARRLSALLRSRAAATLTHPVTAAALNFGGLWLLYTTGLYTAMHHSAALHAAVHLHVFAAGYLFAASILPIDPAPHRTGFKLRTCVMIAAFASHGILGKYLYASPPAGVTVADAHTGAQLMYYGGDAVDLLLIVLFCSAWYKRSGRTAASASPVSRADFG